jgi:Leucine-rich repeat (LRR) protein
VITSETEIKCNEKTWGQEDTCRIDQAIMDQGSTISPQDLIVKRLEILNNFDAKFLPEKLSKTHPNLEEISIWNASFEIVKESHFKGLMKMEYMHIVGAQIETIERGSFKDNSNLTSIDFTNNKIKYLDEKLFDFLEKLYYLSLKNNQISSIAPLTFKDLKNVETLLLSDNKIRTLSPRTFESMESLLKLDMYNNQLKSLEAELFQNNHHLESLNVGKNELESIDVAIFKDTERWKWVSVSFEGNVCIDRKFGPIERLLPEIEANCQMKQKIG